MAKPLAGVISIVDGDSSVGEATGITLFRGGAGTGKSYTLREVKRGIEAAGRPVVMLAPQRQQVASFLADGLPASTVAQCLRARVVPPRSVVLVDEAGQIGARQLSELVALVRTKGGRLITPNERMTSSRAFNSGPITSGGPMAHLPCGHPTGTPGCHG